MKEGQKMTVTAGDVLRVRKLQALIDGGSAQLAGPPGRHLVVMILGASDAGVPFDVESMLRVMGWVPGPAMQAELDKGKVPCH